MKRDLPKVFKNSINKPINNNKKVFYGNEDRSEDLSTNINTLFKQNQIYRTDIELTLTDKTITKKIIGRTNKNLITIDNEIIPISEIKSVKIIK